MFLVQFKGNVTNATNLGIGQMHAPTSKEWDTDYAVMEGISTSTLPTEESGVARSALVGQGQGQVVAAEESLAEGLRTGREPLSGGSWCLAFARLARCRKLSVLIE